MRYDKLSSFISKAFENAANAFTNTAAELMTEENTVMFAAGAIAATVGCNVNIHAQNAKTAYAYTKDRFSS